MPDQADPRYLTLEIERTDNVAIVRCHGQLVSGLTGVLYSNVRPLISNSKRVVLDMSEITAIDSMGLGTLVGLYTSVEDGGVRVAVPQYWQACPGASWVLLICWMSLLLSANMVASSSDVGGQSAPG